jgi:hypothetical protein
MAWAYRFTLFWLILSLAIFGTGYAIAEMGEAAQDTRAAMFIMLGTIIITSAIWQAVALALARFENLILPRLETDCCPAVGRPAGTHFACGREAARLAAMPRAVAPI